jgi:hypothetical protein
MSSAISKRRRILAGAAAIVATAGGMALSPAPASADTHPPFTPIFKMPDMDTGTVYRIVAIERSTGRADVNIGAQHFATNGLFELGVRPKDSHNPAGEQWLFERARDLSGNGMTVNGNPVVHLVSNRVVNGGRYAMDTEQIPFAIEGPGSVVGTSPIDRSATQQWILAKVGSEFTLLNRSLHSPRLLSFDPKQNRFEQRDSAQQNSIQFHLEVVV